MEYRYIVYQTTNTLNGMIYVGVHKTKNINDSYLGSGTRFNYAVRKYGKDSFIRKTLYEFDNHVDMLLKEAEIVDSVFVKRDNTYNIKIGGAGAGSYGNYPEDVLQKIKAGQEKGMARCHEMFINGERTSKNFLGKTHTTETKQLMSDAKAGKYTGSENSQYGTCWIYNSELQKNKKIPKIELDRYALDGWVRGRKIK